jgi:sarcosine oxidase subunit beta
MTSGDPDAVRSRVERQRSVGLNDVEFLDGDEVRYRFPSAGPEVTAASWRAKDGWLSAHELTYGFAKASAATFALRTEAKGISTDSSGVSAVVTGRGTIATRRVMISTGPFASVVAGWLGISLPLVNLRRQKAVIGRVPQVPRHAPMTIDADTGAYWRPEVEGAALGWALPEEPGPPTENVPTDWTFPAVVLDGAARLTPFWNGVAATLTRDNVFLSAGQYTCSPDNKPIIGPSACVRGLHFNLGYAGHGIMASPGGSRLAIDLLLHPEQNEQNLFRLERFGKETTELCREAMVI